MTARQKLICAMISAAHALTVLFVVWLIDRTENIQYQTHLINLVADKMYALRINIDLGINSRIRILNRIEDTIRLTPNLDKRHLIFTVQEMIEHFPDIRAVELAPNSIIRFIHPVEGNEMLMGMDLRNLPGQREQVEEIIKKRKFTLAGPFEFSPVGTVIIGRMPVYIPLSSVLSKSEDYWGFASIIIDFNKLFAELQWPSGHPDVDFALRGKDGLGREGEVFLGDPGLFGRFPLTTEVQFPNGSWILAAAPAKGWDAKRPGAVFFLIAGVILAAILGLSAWMLARFFFIKQAIEFDLMKASQAKSEFMAKMSHELRTPLNAIIGFSEVMACEALGKHNVPRYRDYANDIYASGVHLLDLVNTILDFEKIKAGKYELHFTDFDVAELATGAMKMLEMRAREAGIAMHSEIPSDLPLLRADMRALKQVLLNLLSNAVKFTKKGGSITVKALVAGQGRITLQVSDTGIGIAKEDIGKALSEFGQIYNEFAFKHHGSGLGLPLSKMLVELHGGDFQLQSGAGAGTTITIAFPPERTVPRALPGAASHIANNI